MTTEKAVLRTHENRRGARRGEEGFTLMETVIAMILMMVVGLGASALFLYSVTNNSAAGARAQALAVAQQEMERLRSVAWDNALLNTTTAPVGASDPHHVAGGFEFVVTKNVVTLPAFNVTVGGVTRPTVKQITISVTPILNNAPWAAGGVTITTTRATLQRGPN
ncbi:MAG TPA: prepilin-type N-terminal cleavage/methylation domain-containing protein [Pyrinomonadaceae bacterium]|jgi:Tfp pilus assembly protein PilV|nr:prepilin-type N-terminal cleavage/methylation domain-containing protein [Pyrinomonadaceae bacterium]